ncbi:hypothetical protein SDC9_173440 [bioreactor metagenome]|uniref:Tripartite ATP-independent periplasmic transporters DctQ component domain-containing protein n=1 Tax=bioreactor metagenome TaxID=1076179 RepID=A0A645GGH4_9ZZZZ
MMWFIFPGMVKVFYDKQDIVIDLFTGMMPKSVQKIFAILSSGIITIFCAVLTWQSYLFMMINIKKKMFTSQLPTKYYLIAIVLCVGITTVMSLTRTLEMFVGEPKKGEAA